MKKTIQNWKNQLRVALITNSREYTYVSDIYDMLNLIDAIESEDQDIHKIKSVAMFKKLSPTAKKHVPRIVQELLTPKHSIY